MPDFTARQIAIGQAVGKAITEEQTMTKDERITERIRYQDTITRLRAEGQALERQIHHLKARAGGHLRAWGRVEAENKRLRAERDTALTSLGQVDHYITQLEAERDSLREAAFAVQQISCALSRSVGHEVLEQARKIRKLEGEEE